MSIVSITVAPTDTNLTSLDNACEILGIATGTDDTRVNNLIARASAVIQTYCGDFGLRTVSERFDLAAAWPTVICGGWSACAPNGSRQPQPLILSHAPVASVTSIVEDGTALTTDDYLISGGLAYRLAGGALTGWNANVVTVTYAAGYALPDNVPPDVEAACLGLIQGAYTSMTIDPSIVSEQIEGVGRVQYDRSGSSGISMSIGPHIASLLVNYRQVAW